jgi:hypothetical protein
MSVYLTLVLVRVLEGANIKLAAVVSDIMGVSSRDMMRMSVMIEGKKIRKNWQPSLGVHSR